MKKMFAAGAVLGLFLALPPCSFSQEKITLTLEDSIRMALERNPNHLAAGQRVAAAKSQLREAAAGFFPTLTAQGTGTLDEKLFALEFPSFIPGEPPQRVEVDFTRDYQFTLALNFPLFTGGRLTSGFKQAKYNLESSRESVRQSRHATVFNTKRAFYGCLLAEKFVEVAEEGLKVAEKHYAQVKTMYDVGMASKFDLLRAEVQAANLRPQLIRARNNLSIAKLSLKTLVGIDLDRPLEIKGKLEFSDKAADVAKSLEMALSRRPELNQLEFQQKMAGEMLKIARSEYMPTIALSGTYNYWADRLTFGKDIWQNYYTVNLVFSLPIFNGLATSARVAQSKAAMRELKLVHKGLENAIRFEVRQAALKLTEAKESLLSQGRNVEQAEESLRIAELNYAEGLATSLDVSSTQAALTQAKTNYAQALYDYVLASAELEKVMGMDGNYEN